MTVGTRTGWVGEEIFLKRCCWQDSMFWEPEVWLDSLVGLVALAGTLP